MIYYLRFHPASKAYNASYSLALSADAPRFSALGNYDDREQAGGVLASHGVTWNEGDWREVVENVWALEGPAVDPLTFDAGTSASDSRTQPAPYLSWADTLGRWGLTPTITPDGVWIGGKLYRLYCGDGDISGTMAGSVSYSWHPVCVHQSALRMVDRIAGTPGVARSAAEIAAGIEKVAAERDRTGGEEIIRDGIPEEVFTEGQRQDNAWWLAAWLTGSYAHVGHWSAYPQTELWLDSSIPDAVKRVAHDVICAIWDDGVA